MIRRQQEYEIFGNSVEKFFLLYLVQALPGGLQTRFLPIFFRKNGMSLVNLGFYRCLLIPWVFKPLLVTIVDTHFNKRSWLKGSEIIMLFLCIIAANLPAGHNIYLVLVLFLINCTTSVQDIALDGIILESMTPSALVSGNFAQNVGGRVGSMFAGGFFASLIDTVSLKNMFYIMAVLYLGGFFISYALPPPSLRGSLAISGSNTSYTSDGASNDQEDSLTHLSCQYFQLFQTAGTIWMTIFLFFYKMGDSGVTSTFPMFLIDIGHGASHVGMWTSLSGDVFSIIGSTAVGIFTAGSMLKTLVLLSGVRAMSVAFLWLLLLYWDNYKTSEYSLVFSLFFLTLVFFTGGGISQCTSVLLMQLSRTSPRRCWTLHYNTLVTVDSLSRMLMSPVNGIIAEYMGYYFVFGLFTIQSVLVLFLFHNAPMVLKTHV